MPARHPRRLGKSVKLMIICAYFDDWTSFRGCTQWHTACFDGEGFPPLQSALSNGEPLSTFPPTSPEKPVVASKMLMPATSAGNDSRRISRFSRPMVRDMRWRAHRLREKVRRCCKDGQYVGDAVSISAFATLPGVDGWMPGTSVIALTAIAASLTVSQSPGLRSTRPSAC